MTPKLTKLLEHVVHKQNEVLEQFIATWIAVKLRPGDNVAAARAIVENMRLCTRLEGTTQKFWLEFKDAAEAMGERGE